jgi:hypothetical protein
MQILTIEQQWQTFQTACFPNPDEPPSDLQRVEMRRAFYAGFVACFYTVSRDITTLPDSRAERELEKINGEIGAYVATLAAAAARATRRN